MTEPEIVEMTPAESEHLQWSMSSDGETFDWCVCNHDGLGVDWHAANCPAVGYLINHKLRELFGAKLALDAMIDRAHRYDGSGNGAVGRAARRILGSEY